MVVTKIQRARREPRRFVLHIDGQPLLRISETLLASTRISEGSELDQATFDRLAERATYEEAYQQALSFLSYRPRSSREVRDKLARKKIDRSVADRVVEQLQDQRFLNDGEFARMFVRDKLKGKPMGRALLRKKLLEKGISFQLSEKVLKEYVTDDNEEAAARSLLVRKLRTGSKKLTEADTLKRQKKLTEYLLRRGFSADIASKTARALSRQ